MDDDGYRWAQGLIWAANWPGGWSANPNMILPVGNTTPANPKRIQLVLTGVYFDKCSSLSEYNAQGVYDPFVNDSNPYLFNKFGKDKSNTINIFVMNYKMSTTATTGGIASGIGPTPAQGCWVKIMAPWQANYTAATSTPATTVYGPWAYSNILNHELGHVLGLFHSYSGDDCADTPNNPGCWDNNSADCAGATPPQPASNNMMDYNNVQNALTPCQITKIHNTIGANQMALVDACGTCGPTHAIYGLRVGTTAVTGAYNVTSGNLVMNGAASVNESNFVISIYQVAGLNCTTPVGSVFSQAYNQAFDNYTLSGATYGAGEINLSSLFTFQANKVYRIRLRTYNGCSADSVIQTVHTYTSGLIPECGGGGGSRSAPPTATQGGGLTLEVHPNPASSAASITYYLPTEESVSLMLLNSQGQPVRRILNDTRQLAGKHDASLSVQGLPNGLYQVVATSGGKRVTTNLLIKQ